MPDLISISRNLSIRGCGVADSFLQTGMHLTRAEFERRYKLRPEVKKAELINGFVIMGSPVSAEHGEYEGRFGSWLGYYASKLPDCRTLHNTTLRIDNHNEVQPDVALVLQPGSKADPAEGYLEKPLELVVEIAWSSAMYDRHEKYDLYERFGIQEYIICEIADQKVVWFNLEDQGYRALPADANGIVQSRRFPGLRLNVPEILKGNMAQAFAELERGLAAPEFAAFRSTGQDRP